MGQVLIGGKRAPILGRVCMDQFMVDVTEIPGVQVGTPVTLVGTDGNETLSMEEVSGLAHSFNYELPCRIARQVLGCITGTVCRWTQWSIYLYKRIKGKTA